MSPRRPHPAATDDEMYGPGEADNAESKRPLPYRTRHDDAEEVDIVVVEPDPFPDELPGFEPRPPAARPNLTRGGHATEACVAVTPSASAEPPSFDFDDRADLDDINDVDDRADFADPDRDTPGQPIAESPTGNSAAQPISPAGGPATPGASPSDTFPGRAWGMIDPSRYDAFNLLDSKRMNRGHVDFTPANGWPSRGWQIGGIWFGVAGIDHALFAPSMRDDLNLEQDSYEQADAAERRTLLDRAAGRLKFGGLLRRVLFAIHCRVTETRRSSVQLADCWLGRMVWGADTAWPKNWRAVLAGALDAALVLHVATSVDDRPRFGPATALVLTVSDDRGTNGAACGVTCPWRGVPGHHHFAVNIGSGFLGSLESLAVPWQDDVRVYDWTYRVPKDDDAPSLQKLGRAGQLRTFFVPAVLSTPDVCRDLGAFANTLVRETTRRRTRAGTKPQVIKGNVVPGFNGSAGLPCPMLADGRFYVGFNANGVRRRRGGGYLLKTWASKAGHADVDHFIDALAEAVPRLGLIVAGIRDDANSPWVGVDELRSLDPVARQRVHLRVYTASDFVARWSRLFGWNPSAGPVAGPTSPTAELSDLKTMILAKGSVVAAAEAIGTHRGTLSRVLSGRQRPQSDLLSRLRQYARTAPSSGTGAGTMFADATSMRDFALAYRRAGLSVIPMASPHGGRGKPARVKWKPYQSTRPSAELITQWWTQWPDAGIGLVLGYNSGVFAIDVDGEDAYDALVDRLGEEPRAPKSFSGSGDPFRLHLFFRHPAVKTLARATPWHPKLEFRGHGGLLVLPPSPHKSGNRYRWATGQSIEELELPEVPGLVLEALEKKAEPVTPLPLAAAVVTNAVTPGMALAPSTARFVSGAFADAPGWNPKLFVAACDMNARGVPKEAAVPLLLAGAKPWNPACEAAARTTIDQAYSQPRTPSAR